MLAQYIDETDRPIIFTAGLDKMAKIWSDKGELMGTLRQGIMKMPDKPWEFPLSHHYPLIYIPRVNARILPQIGLHFWF
jgi:hypothetical protein